MTVADRVRAVLADAPVIDGHNDLAWALRHRVGYDFDKLDIAVDQSAAGLHTDLPRLRAGGVGAQFWSVYVPCALSGDAAVVATLEQIDAVRRVRDSDGIVMVNFSAGFLNEECREWIDGLFAERERLAQDFGDHGPEWYRAQTAWLQANPRPPCEVGDVADHIEQVRKVAGVDHVGLGSDFDGVAAVPDGLEGVDGYPALLAELASRGWSDSELAKLTWHNAMRVLRATESAAAEAQRTRGPSLATFAELDLPAAP